MWGIGISELGPKDPALRILLTMWFSIYGSRGVIYLGYEVMVIEVVTLDYVQDTMGEQHIRIDNLLTASFITVIRMAFHLFISLRSIIASFITIAWICISSPRIIVRPARHSCG